LGFREFISLHSSQFTEILKVKTTSTFITKYFAIPPFFHTFATAKRAHQALQYWFRSSVGLEQQPSKLWVLGSNPNGITERGTPKTGVPLFVFTPMYVFAPNNYIDSVSVKVHKQFFIPESSFLAYYSYFCLSNMLRRTFFLQYINKQMARSN
jgi:hypothetical protein